MPKYLCWMPGDDPHASSDDGVEVHAFSAWSAAKAYVKRADDDSGSEISQGAVDSGAKLRVHVLSPDGVESMWYVWPDIETYWYASVAGVVEKQA